MMEKMENIVFDPVIMKKTSLTHWLKLFLTG